MTLDDRPAQPSWHDRRLSRRGFLAGTAATVSAGALVGRLPAVAHAAEGGLATRCRAPTLLDQQEPAGGRPLRDDVQAVAGVCAERRTADQPGQDHGRGPDGAGRQPSQHQPGAVRRVHLRRAVHRPRHHVRHHAAQSAARGSRTRPSTSEQRVTTSIRSTDADRRTTWPSTTRPTGTNCSWRRTSTVSSMCRVTATAGPSSRTHAMTRT